MPTPAVETDALVKKYPKVQALSGVSLSIEPTLLSTDMSNV